MPLETIRVSGMLSPENYETFKHTCQLLGIRRRDAVRLAVEAWMASMAVAMPSLEECIKARQAWDREEQLLSEVRRLATLPGD